MARAFIAAYPPAAVVEELLAVPRAATPDVRWTPPEQWHVTLRFFGACDLELLEQRFAELVGPPATARSGRVGRLGRDALVVPISGLDELAGAVRAATADIGRPPEHERFLGHLTLARLRGAPACGLIGEAVDIMWEVDEIALVESVLDPAGARHTVVARRRLGVSS